MSRSLGVLAASLVVLALAPRAASAAEGFAYGVSAGEVTSRSAVLWTRSDTPGRLRLQVTSRRRFRGKGVLRRTVRARAAHDGTVSVPVRRLAPGRRYRYRFVHGSRRSDVGRFTTAPRARRARRVSFAYTGDADAQPAPGTTTPFYNAFQIYRRMAGEGNDFNVDLGDTIYSDSEVPGSAPAVTVADKWAKYRQNLAQANLQRARRAAAMYDHWDDHEFLNDFSVPELGEPLYAAGVRAFRDYMPVHYTARTGLYRHFRWGRAAELFFLDERSFRSAKASAGGVCDNPATGAPDLAPTAPASIRSLFAVLIPSLTRPVAQACLDTIRSPQRTLLGARQHAAFVRAVRRSTATFKIVMNEVPIQQFYGLPYDRWEGYEAERRRLLDDLAGVRNVVLLTTDDHATFYNDVRRSTFPEEGGTVDTGFKELTTGPAATMTFAREIDAAVGRQGAGRLLTEAFFKPAPPAGVGMPCAQPDAYSYTQVDVTTRRVRLTPKGIDGRPLQQTDPAGRVTGPCGPFTLRAR